MQDARPLVALLLVGGAGTRLWPASTEARPKQFLKLFGDRSLFQATLARLAAASVDETVVMTGAAHAALVAEQAAEIGVRAHVLLEPLRRDSAAAIAAGVAWITQAFGSEARIAVLPSDHFIPDAAAFAAAVARGALLAGEGWLVTFGIRPTWPTTEYGYIQRGAALASQPDADAFAVAKFHEKPRREVAEAYLSDGGFDWNSGIFMFASGAFAAEAMRHMPDIWEPAKLAIDAGRRDDTGHWLDADAFGRARKSSIDYALFEKSDRVVVLPVAFEWHDIGNWGSAYEAFRQGEGGNVAIGDTLLEDVGGTIVVADRVKVVVCGLRDVAVIASPEGVFVAPRAKAAEIKRLLGG